MDIVEYCNLIDCGIRIPRPCYCIRCEQTFCTEHKNPEEHDCDSLKNLSNTNTSSKIVNKNNENDNRQIIKCYVRSCNKTSVTDIFIKCKICCRAYCISHQNVNVHNCSNIKLPQQQIAFNNGYTECDTCGFINAPSTEECMVCSLFHSDIIVTCTYCDKLINYNKYKIHLLTCLKKIKINKNNSMKCPYCTQSILNKIYDKHILSCVRGNKNERFRRNHNKNTKTMAPDADINLICNKCLKYVHYKTYDTHTDFCKGIIKQNQYKNNNKSMNINQEYEEKVKHCPFCKINVDTKGYMDHLAVCSVQNDLNDDDDDDVIEDYDVDTRCPYCIKYISSSEYKDHVLACGMQKSLDVNVNKTVSSIVNKWNENHNKLDKKHQQTQYKYDNFFARNNNKTKTNKTLDYIKQKRRRRRKGPITKYLSKSSNVIKVKKDNYNKKRKFKDGYTDDTSPMKKRRKLNVNIKDLSISVSGDFRIYVPNKRILFQPYYNKSCEFVKSLKNNSNINNNYNDDEYLGDIGFVKCFWYFPCQHDHSEQAFRITNWDYKLLNNENEEFSDKLIDFGLKYLYSSWLPILKQRIYIFPTKFYRNQLSMIKVNKKKKNNDNNDDDEITFYDFLFNKDFLIIPKKNDLQSAQWELIIICYHKYVINQNKFSNLTKACIVTLSPNANAKRDIKTNQRIRKWLNLQYKYLTKNVDDIFTSSTIRAFNSVQVPKLVGSKKYSGCYLLMNFKCWGMGGGYTNTTNIKHLHNLRWYGFKKAERFRKQLTLFINTMSKQQEYYL